MVHDSSVLLVLFTWMREKREVVWKQGNSSHIMELVQVPIKEEKDKENVIYVHAHTYEYIHKHTHVHAHAYTHNTHDGTLFSHREE